MAIVLKYLCLHAVKGDIGIAIKGRGYDVGYVMTPTNLCVMYY